MDLVSHLSMGQRWAYWVLIILNHSLFDDVMIWKWRVVVGYWKTTTSCPFVSLFAQSSNVCLPQSYFPKAPQPPPLNGWCQGIKIKIIKMYVGPSCELQRLLFVGEFLRKKTKELQSACCCSSHFWCNCTKIHPSPYLLLNVGRMERLQKPLDPHKSLLAGIVCCVCVTSEKLHHPSRICCQTIPIHQKLGKFPQKSMTSPEKSTKSMVKSTTFPPGSTLRSHRISSKPLPAALHGYHWGRWDQTELRTWSSPRMKSAL